MTFVTILTSEEQYLHFLRMKKDKNGKPFSKFFPFSLAVKRKECTFAYLTKQL